MFSSRAHVVRRRVKDSWVISGKRGGDASASSVGPLRSDASTRLRSSHLRRLPQNGLPTPLSARFVSSASREASLASSPPRAAIRQYERRRRARGLHWQPPAVIRFGVRSPRPEQPLFADILDKTPIYRSTDQWTFRSVDLH